MPGFFDEYQDIGGGGAFIKAPEKEALANQGVPFEITKVLDDDENKYGARYVLRIVVPEGVEGVDGGDRSMSFGKDSVESRDRMLRQVQQYVEREDAEPVVVKLSMVGKSWILSNATE